MKEKKHDEGRNCFKCEYAKVLENGDILCNGLYTIAKEKADIVCWAFKQNKFLEHDDSNESNEVKKAAEEETKITINETICKLEQLNRQMNSNGNKDISKLVLKGIIDNRDSMIDFILCSPDFNKKFKEESMKLKHFYNSSDFDNATDKVLRILLKSFTFHTNNIDSPISYLISHCFKKRTFSDGKIVISYFEAYFNRNKAHLLELNERPYGIDPSENSKHDDECDQDYYESNKFDMEFHQAMIDIKDTRADIGKKYFADTINEIDTTFIGNVDDDDEKISEMDADDIKEIRDITICNSNYINDYSFNYDEIRHKYIIESDEKINRRYEKVRISRIKKWESYKDNVGFIPYQIEKLKKKNYIMIHQNNENKKYKDMFMYVKCPPKDIDKTKNEVEKYFSKIINKALSKREKELINKLYYEMAPLDKILKVFNYSNKSAMDKVKSKCNLTLERALLEKYDYIQSTFGESKIAYWLRKIHKKNLLKINEKIQKVVN